MADGSLFELRCTSDRYREPQDMYSSSMANRLRLLISYVIDNLAEGENLLREKVVRTCASNAQLISD